MAKELSEITENVKSFSNLLNSYDVTPIRLNLGCSEDMNNDLELLDEGRVLSSAARRIGHRCDFYEETLAEHGPEKRIYTLLVHNGEKLWMPRIIFGLKSILSNRIKKMVEY